MVNIILYVKNNTSDFQLSVVVSNLEFRYNLYWVYKQAKFGCKRKDTITQF